ncbi:malate synthase G [Virgibacillus alimentarius]|uniref:Malate synthase G n=1 Tax=Virgibacillus alimentarius TaxID=698769 RepID=A0ABS4SAQ0_9BACI|nr:MULTISPECIES: malate synthase G [Virgibacillus]MBP2258489.1 malate synthase [Virgibacillus alimentarius]HLR69235.1 malate synthase G [Virgibacillus sp.]
MNGYVDVGSLKVAKNLYEFINKEAIPGSETDTQQFWIDFEKLINDLTPENDAILEKRKDLQEKMNQYHKENKSNDFHSYKQFLKEIGYLQPIPEDFRIETENVDDELKQAGPQLVVPVNNSRYALNAANSRWGSLYDALYGTDVISEENGADKTAEYNPIRGQKVIEFGREFLDETIPLQKGTHKNVGNYSIVDGELVVTLKDGTVTSLKENEKLTGFQGNANSPTSILFKNNGLHFDMQIDPSDPIGKTDDAGIKDIVLEAALSTIIDCEDSVAAVDAEDKVEVYRNWLGLMKGDLSTSFKKGGKEVTRTLNPDRIYQSLDHKEFSLFGRSLMFVRNVGHLMTNSAILNKDNAEVYEGMLDAVITSLIGKHSLLKKGVYDNSRKGSIYIVKPKMHSPEEAAFANKLFNRVEDMLSLERNTLKIGLMDEERRISLNLKAAIKEVKERIAFINTGFLDRTGDEIHTSMEAGPMIRKQDMKASTWIAAYEKSNVFTGLGAGFSNHAQIGKGMWAAPDKMKNMLDEKLAHPKAGANTAWVPSPTAATLHAIHYHQINVKDKQIELEKQITTLQNDLLTIPIAEESNWSNDEIQEELNNNAQGILGYVVRWINQGVGCSKVPDINNVGLMEDRATLRISSQHIANWLYHGICTKEQVIETMKRMAKIVDEQNANDPDYMPMSNDFEKSIAFQAACDLVLKGRDQPSGYTEPILHQRRLELKQQMASGVNI